MEIREMRNPVPEDVLACKLAMSLLEECGTYEKARAQAKELAETCLKMHRVYTETHYCLDMEENIDKPLTTGN